MTTAAEQGKSAAGEVAEPADDPRPPAGASAVVPAGTGVADDPGRQPRAQAGFRVALRAAVLEAGLVVFGVVLAFAANEWREHRAAVARADHALASILEELRTNRDAVASSLAYHDGLLGAIVEASRSGAAPGIQTFSRGFISPASVYRTAWDSASATGALEAVDFALLLRLSRVYAQQARYEQQSANIGPLLYGELYRGGMAGVLANYRNLSSLIGAMAYRERELVAACEDALAELGPTADR
jgi:hypothetical protein